MWAIVYIHDGVPRGWHVIDIRTQEVVSGPYADPQEAQQSIETRAWRLAQGWAP